MAKSPHAVALGRKGGKVKSEAKAIAARANGRKPKQPRVKKQASYRGEILGISGEHDYNEED